MEIHSQPWTAGHFSMNSTLCPLDHFRAFRKLRWGVTPLLMPLLDGAGKSTVAQPRTVPNEPCTHTGHRRRRWLGGHGPPLQSAASTSYQALIGWAQALRTALSGGQHAQSGRPGRGYLYPGTSLIAPR